MNKEKTPYLIENKERDTFTIYIKGTKPYIEQQKRIDKAIEYFKYQLENLDFYEDTKARMLCAMGITLLQNGSDDNED